MQEAAAMGAYLEYVYLNHLMGPHAHLGWMRHWKQVSLSDLAKAIKTVGAAHFILSSDLGQSGNPTHPDGYAKMVAGLKKAGVSQADLDLMMKKNPAKLLGLDN
jgi:microsomal dipeptidase-like Zn-dependent dipeptidase